MKCFIRSAGPIALTMKARDNRPAFRSCSRFSGATPSMCSAPVASTMRSNGPRVPPRARKRRSTLVLEVEGRIGLAAEPDHAGARRHPQQRLLEGTANGTGGASTMA